MYRDMFAIYQWIVLAILLKEISTEKVPKKHIEVNPTCVKFRSGPDDLFITGNYPISLLRGFNFF